MVSVIKSQKYCPPKLQTQNLLKKTLPQKWTSLFRCYLMQYSRFDSPFGPVVINWFRFWKNRVDFFSWESQQQVVSRNSDFFNSEIILKSSTRQLTPAPNSTSFSYFNYAPIYDMRNMSETYLRYYRQTNHYNGTPGDEVLQRVVENPNT